MICKQILKLTFLTEPKLIFCSHLNGFKYSYQTLIILFSINHLFTKLYIQTVLDLPIKFNMNHVCTQFKCQTVLIDGTLSGAITPGQSGPRSNGNEGALRIPRSFRIGASPWDCLMSIRTFVGGGRIPVHRCWRIL